MADFPTWQVRTHGACVLNSLEFPSRAFYYLRTHRPYVRTSQSYIPPVQKICLIRVITLIKNLCALCAFAWDKKIISHTESTKFTECLHLHGARVKQIAILCVPCFLCAKKLRVDPRNPWRHIINMISQISQLPCGVQFYSWDHSDWLARPSVRVQKRISNFKK